jgi:hypothetical protein
MSPRSFVSACQGWEVRKKLAKQDGQVLLIELNSATGTLGDEIQRTAIVRLDWLDRIDA